MKTNPLLFWTAVALGAFWSIGFLIPGPVLSMVMSGSVAVISGISLLSTATPVYRILFHGERDQTEKGSHLAVIGSFALSVAAFWLCMFNLSWFLMGQPETWLFTPFSTFSRYAFFWGFLLMFLSPHVGTGSLSIKINPWLIAMIALLIIAAYLLGRYVSNDHTAERQEIILSTICPRETPIKGNRASMIYHTPASRSYLSTHPEACFRSEQDARVAGYRAAR